MSREDEIIDAFMRCKNPVLQVGIAAELAGCDIQTVLDVLKKAGKIPKRTTPGNYKRILCQMETVEMTPELAAHVRSMHEGGCTKAFIERETGLLMKQIERALATSPGSGCR